MHRKNLNHMKMSIPKLRMQQEQEEGLRHDLTRCRLPPFALTLGPLRPARICSKRYKVTWPYCRTGKRALSRKSSTKSQFR